VSSHSVAKTIELMRKPAAWAYGCVTITTYSSTDGATTPSRMNLSGHVWRVTIFGWMFTIACCLVVRWWLGT